MTLTEKYREFTKQYEEELEHLYYLANGSENPAEKTIAGIFKKFAYPLTMKEWLVRELKEAVQSEDFEYAKEVKQEIEKL